ncbi:AraC family transcriptional regulator [Brevibacterium sanguinis]|uniref:AraC family transcriptional regulator n=3 Tax=Brevibacteriaceae TaxID=85019 RepID=A0A366III2_9MICO|nr:AraC family transcriptional regulator [Brevibacterium sanguinis]RBP70275.1 AraC family transcriptional regulator [Brevibacterium celere]
MYGRVLRPHEMLTRTRYSSAEPAAELRPWVLRYWSVAWDLPEGERYLQTTLSEPSIHLTVERGDLQRANTDGAGIWLTGPVTRERFDVAIFGTGGVIGVNFRLGGTRAFCDHRPAGIRDTTVPAARWFPDAAELAGLDDLDTAAQVLDGWLLARRPRTSEALARFLAVLEVMEDPEVTHLGELSRRCGMSERTLQRLFHDHCGVGVKRMLVRARIRDAVAALDRGWEGTLSELGASLGWFDQSHFSSDFRRTIGCSPGEYLAGRDGAP